MEISKATLIPCTKQCDSDPVNTLYGCKTTIVFTLKMESVPKITILIWPKNDGEKWFRKIYFEIPPCGKMVIFVTEFEKSGKLNLSLMK